jgi:DNA-binding beta-propeller fold protein YncE
MPQCIRFRSVTVVLLVSFAILTFAQQSKKQEPEKGKRAASRLALGKTCSLEYVGAFVADGAFKGKSKLRLGEWVDTIAGQPDDQAPASSAPSQRDDVAPSKQRVVQDYEPGAHPVETVNGRPVLADVVDAITSFVEEHQAVMDAPRGVTTDSAGRVIVADPPAHAVHVLDFRGKTSFRIQGGKDRRLQTPVGAAADSQNNIYVTDSERGMVLVYDHLGRFRHYLGKIKGEPFFERPEGVAVDGPASRIYVADTPRNVVSVLDLRGQVLTNFGRDRIVGQPAFNKPTSVVLDRSLLFVLDDFGSRVQVLDLEGRVLRQLRTPNDNDSPPDHAGMAIDSHGNIYISDEVRGMVRVYNQEGKLLSVFGRAGSKIGEFSRPLGVWVDARDRFYVADSNNHRIQVFQFRARGQRAGCQ